MFLLCVSAFAASGKKVPVLEVPEVKSLLNAGYSCKTSNDSVEQPRHILFWHQAPETRQVMKQWAQFVKNGDEMHNKADLHGGWIKEYWGKGEETVELTMFYVWDTATVSQPPKTVDAIVPVDKIDVDVMRKAKQRYEKFTVPTN